MALPCTVVQPHNSAASLPLHTCTTDALNACPPRAFYLRSCGENRAYRSGGDLLYLGTTNAKQYLLSGLMIHDDCREGRMRGENLSCSHSTRSSRPTDVVIHFGELIKYWSGSEEGLADVGIPRYRESVLVSGLLDHVRCRACSIQYADSQRPGPWPRWFSLLRGHINVCPARPSMIDTLLVGRPS
ncbi:hypothetical protein BR93DRAFT_94770 [Coniochaeta sp. PMI_546]|nr:hypothetical protein BR93DRAFT_94770 [Coniochaeta sp. PMI_546]